MTVANEPFQNKRGKINIKTGKYAKRGKVSNPKIAENNNAIPVSGGMDFVEMDADGIDDLMDVGCPADHVQVSVDAQQDEAEFPEVEEEDDEPNIIQQRERNKESFKQGNLEGDSICTQGTGTCVDNAIQVDPEVIFNLPDNLWNDE